MVKYAARRETMRADGLPESGRRFLQQLRSSDLQPSWEESQPLLSLRELF